MEWRIVGRVGVWTTDNRLIESLSMSDAGDYVRAVVENEEPIWVAVRLWNGRIEALLPVEFPEVTPSLKSSQDDVYVDLSEPVPRITFKRARVAGLGPGPSAWTEADLR